MTFNDSTSYLPSELSSIFMYVERERAHFEVQTQDVLYIFIIGIIGIFCYVQYHPVQLCLGYQGQVRG